MAGPHHGSAWAEIQTLGKLCSCIYHVDYVLLVLIYFSFSVRGFPTPDMNGIPLTLDLISAGVHRFTYYACLSCILLLSEKSWQPTVSPHRIHPVVMVMGWSILQIEKVACSPLIATLCTAMNQVHNLKAQNTIVVLSKKSLVNKM